MLESLRKQSLRCEKHLIHVCEGVGYNCLLALISRANVTPPFTLLTEVRAREVFKHAQEAAKFLKISDTTYSEVNIAISALEDAYRDY